MRQKRSLSLAATTFASVNPNTRPCVLIQAKELCGSRIDSKKLQQTPQNDLLFIRFFFSAAKLPSASRRATGDVITFWRPSSSVAFTELVLRIAFSADAGIGAVVSDIFSRVERLIRENAERYDFRGFTVR